MGELQCSGPVYLRVCVCVVFNIWAQQSDLDRLRLEYNCCTRHRSPNPNNYCYQTCVFMEKTKQRLVFWQLLMIRHNCPSSFKMTKNWPVNCTGENSNAITLYE